MIEKTRKIADETRQKIIQSAAALFAKHGFGATSMQSIANKAQVNQALLYHHFSNKKNLWQRSKVYLLQSATAKQKPIHTNVGLHQLLTQIIEQRFTLYKNNNIMRMMLWQQLEPNPEGLISPQHSSTIEWGKAFTIMQQKNLMRKDIKLNFILCWISSSITGVIFGHQVFFNQANNKKHEYIEMLIDFFYEALKHDSTIHIPDQAS